MTNIASLQRWYSDHCQDDWHLRHGVEIETLRDPGWKLVVDLRGTKLSGMEFPEHSYCHGASPKETRDWIHCTTSNNTFVCVCGPEKLDEAIGVFIAWAAKSP